MSIEAWVVVGVIAAVIAALAATKIAADALLMAALTALLVFPIPAENGWRVGVVGLEDGLRGFANPGMLTVAVLFVVVAGLRETGAIDWIAHHVLGRPGTMRGALARMCIPVGVMSAFLNNTPIVAMMIPAVADWSRRLNFSPSKLMIPLSYATILGGTCSLIGTSTNLVVNGLVQDAGMPGLHMFDITWVGVPCAIVGVAYLIFVSPKLLPDRGAARATLADPRQYTLELLVPPGSAMTGKTVEQAGLRHLPGCYLVGIERNGEPLASVGPEQLLQTNDRLLFAGVVDAIRDVANLRGLAPATDQVFKLDAPRYRRRLFEAVVSGGNPVVGKTIRDGRFRGLFNGVVLAVAREGQRLPGKIGDIELRPGDTLLIEADAGFADRYRHTRDFLLVSGLQDSTPRRHARAPIALAILAVMVALATMGWMDMLQAALIAAGLMIVTRCCTITEARQSVDWSVLVVIAAALGLGIALQETGASTVMAGKLLALAGTNPWMALAVIYLTTMLVNELVTNNAAVALVFPIGYATANELGVNFMPFIMAIMMAGSASFATPIGYQTNLMVYGPGGYTFGDFIRAGGILNLLIAATAIALIPMIWGF